jgi:predicted nuclease with TOPRIM domain
MVDATRPHVVLNGEDLHNIQPDVTPQELREQFAPNVSTLWKMKHSQRLRARLCKVNNRLSEFDKNKQAALDEEGEEEDKFFPIYADRPGSFQADICFMPENQVFNRYQGIVCLISTNRKIAWATAYRAPRDGMTGHRKRRIRAEQMYPLLAQCIDEMERRFHIEVKQIESDDENMFKGVCRQQLQLVMPQCSVQNDRHTSFLIHIFTFLFHR